MTGRSGAPGAPSATTCRSTIHGCEVTRESLSTSASVPISALPESGAGIFPYVSSLVPNQLLVPIHGRGVWLFGKRRDVVDQLRAFFADGPDVPALGTAVVVSARQFARERQKPARRTVTRWTVHKRGHGWGTTHYPSEMAVRARRESSYLYQCLCSKRLRDRLCYRFDVARSNLGRV